MADYISRDSLIKQLGELPCRRLIPITALCSLIKHFPAADVAERKHGKWILTDYEDEQTYKCSECGELWTFIVGTPKDNGANYCPNCGADMRGDNDV